MSYVATGVFATERLKRVLVIAIGVLIGLVATGVFATERLKPILPTLARQRYRGSNRSIRD